MPSIAILAPLLPEARAIARALQLPVNFSKGIESNDKLAVIVVGIRATKVSVVASVRPRAIILAGLAGALSPDLSLGSVVCDHPLHLPNVHYGKIHSSAVLVATPAAKAALFRRTGALAVDMESAPVAILAKSLGVPMLTLRAISDTAADALDPALLTFIDDQGRPVLRRALAHLAAHPSKLPALLHIRKATNLALSNLTAALTSLLESGWPGTPQP